MSAILLAICFATFGHIAGSEVRGRQASSSDESCLFQQQLVHISLRDLAAAQKPSTATDTNTGVSKIVEPSRAQDNALMLAGKTLEAEHISAHQFNELPTQVPTMRQKCATIRLIALGFVAAVTAGISFAIIGLGPGTTILVYWQLIEIVGIASAGVEDAMWCSVMVQIPVSVIQIVYLRSNWNLYLTILLNAPFLVFSPIGSILLEHLASHTSTIKTILGSLFVILAASQTYQEVLHMEEKEEKVPLEHASGRGVGIAIAIMCLTGFAGGLLGCIFPVMMLLFMFFHIDTMLWRFQAAVVGLSYVVVEGSLLGARGTPDWTCTTMYFAFVFGGLLGLMIGNVLAKYTDAKRFRFWSICFLVVAGLLMICNQDRTVSCVAASLLAVIGAGMLLEPFLSRNASTSTNTKNERQAAMARKEEDTEESRNPKLRQASKAF